MASCGYWSRCSMSFKRLKLGRGTKAKYQVQVPVFRVPSSRDYDEFAKDPIGLDSGARLDEKTRGTLRFYAALRYPDSAIDVDYVQK